MIDNEKLKSAILFIADEIDRICRKYNITYTISSGTMLGAIRHKGFIPWDDDFDIEMRRDEFERFITICDKELNNNIFYLQTDKTEQFYAYSFAKIQLNGTLFMEDFSSNVPIHHGIFVDIFPLDKVPNNRIKASIMKINNHIIKSMIWIKCGYGTLQHKKKFSYWLLRIAAAFFKLETLKLFRRDLLNKYNSNPTNYFFISDYPRYRLKCTWYETFCEYNFNGHLFYGLKNYDEYLKEMYGDYMVLPPEAERYNHSNGVISIDINLPIEQ